MKKTFRVCLLIGLILSTALYAYYTVTSFIGMLAMFSMFSTGNTIGDAVLNSMGIIGVGVMLLMFVFSLLGLIFSSLGFSKVGMTPEKFQEKKGKLTKIVVFNFILAALILYGLFEAVEVLSIIFLIAFIAASVLIIIDQKRNKKLLEESSRQAELNNIEEKPKEEKKEE